MNEGERSLAEYITEIVYFMNVDSDADLLQDREPSLDLALIARVEEENICVFSQFDSVEQRTEGILYVIITLECLILASPSSALRIQFQVILLP